MLPIFTDTFRKRIPWNSIYPTTAGTYTSVGGLIVMIVQLNGSTLTTATATVTVNGATVFNVSATSSQTQPAVFWTDPGDTIVITLTNATFVEGWIVR